MTAANTFELEKKVKFVLDKRKINDIPCNVKFGMDVSGSTQSMFRSGIVQAVTERIFAIAMSVDVDKKLDFVAFDSKEYQLPEVSQSNLAGYIDNQITNNSKFWGGTNYAPVIKLLTESVAGGPTPSAEKKGLLGRFFGGKTINQVVVSADAPLPPTLCIIITDGANSDRRETEQALVDSQHLNVYWQLVGIGPNEREFSFIKEMADKYPNVGYTPITDISRIPDEDLYDSILNDEFAEWIVRFK